MSIGPFASYVPPGIYTRTLTESNVAQLVAGLRIPVIIGVGQEQLDQLNVEMVRGSSSTVDQQIFNEDPSLAWVVDSTNPANLVLGPQDGTRLQLRVRNYPIVDGQGFGRVTNDIRTVTVTVNGTPTAVAQVNGQKGLITLQVPPQPTDIVRVTYYFHRGDTQFTDDVSAQVTPDSAILVSPGYGPYVFTAGSNDTLKLRVNGTAYTVVFSAGALTATTVKAQIDALSIANLTTSVYVDPIGQEHIRLLTTQELQILDGSANGPLGWTNYTKTARNVDFAVFNRPITDGGGSGLTTTDTAKVVVKVNNVQVIPAAVNGQNGLVTLTLAPPPGASVRVTYWANTWQDTYDYLPNTLVTQVTQCGIAPGRSDYIQGADFVVSNPTADTSIIHWGTSMAVSAVSTTAGGTPFHDSQIVGTLVDDQMFLGECERVVNTAVNPATISGTDFILPEIPTLGNGRNTPLGTTDFASVTNSRQDVISNRPDLVVVYVGRNLQDALNRPVAKVDYVDGANRLIRLTSSVPADWKAFATFYYNRIVDDTYLFTNKVSGPVGTGQYEVLAVATQEQLYQVNFTKVGLPFGGSPVPQIVQWPRGVENIPDAFHAGSGTPVSETVLVTFRQSAAGNAAYTIKGAESYGLYNPTSATWVTLLQGLPISTSLNAAAPASLVSGHVAVIQPPDVNAGKINVAVGTETLNLEIDGVSIAVTLTTGYRTPTQIVNEINSAIDLDPAFSGTAPNNLAGYSQIGGSSGDVFFHVKSYTTPSALPGGFDSAAKVKIAQGTAETTLGFKTFQTATGTSGAICKPATLLGSVAGPYVITTGVNDTLKVRVDGVDYTVALPGGASVTTTAVVTAINAVIPSFSSVGTLGNLNHLRLTSPTNTTVSSIVILDGTANAILGFVQNEQASQVRVTAQEIVNALNATAGFLAAGIAYVTSVEGLNYVTIESITTGAATSSVGFGSSANSAFNTGTGLNITPGTDGDIGEDPRTVFDVRSTNPLGSAGTGTPGQTYTDARTGLRFTVLPSTTTYQAGKSFGLVVSTTFAVNPAVPFYAIPGVETTVSNTVGVVPGDVGQIQTFHPGGAEPKVGDFYYISYKYQKQDFSTRIFRQLKTIEANFGVTSPANRVTLAAYLAILNGALLVGIKQVRKVPNTNQASDADFIAAIQALSTPMPGNVKPDILVPLATSTSVYAALTSHVETMSLIQNQAERMGFIGFASGTTPSNAATIAASLSSNRIVALYPDSVVVTLTDELGQSFDSLVDGTFFAAAVAGAAVSPSVDVATPYTRRRIQGFTSIPRILDPVEANQTAVKGVTLIEDLDPVIRIRQGLTTNMQSPLTRLPTVTQIADYVQQQSRQTLDSFVGTKFLATRTQEVNVSMTSLFKQMVQAEIVGGFTGISSTVDPDDPTVMRFEAYYQPIFPLLYIVMSFNLRASV